MRPEKFIAVEEPFLISLGHVSFAIFSLGIGLWLKSDFPQTFFFSLNLGVIKRAFFYIVVGEIYHMRALLNRFATHTPEIEGRQRDGKKI